jgi:hypothetical protein
MTTTKLSLPELTASQSQKHVTHNEALFTLDNLVQLSVIDKDLATPPGSPSEGDAYIVAATATGDWVGQEGKVTSYDGDGWTFFAPVTGWLAYNQNAGELLIYDGTSWDGLVNNLVFSVLGVNATADTTNRLSVTAPAALFNNESGDIQVKLNKAATTDSASFLFQSAWSGRAEIGLTGDDDFHFKVSPDGSTWYNGITIDKDNGYLSLTGFSGQLPVFDTGNSVFIGEDAGLNDDLSDNKNVFIGSDAGLSNTAGYNSVAIGAYAMRSNTTGYNNCAVGVSALYDNTTGGNNTAINAYALRSNTTGASSTAVGVNALYANTTGSYNSATGFSALRFNTTGASNLAVGMNALYANTTGSYNSAMGRDAMYDSTTGTSNSAVGVSALRSNTAGYSNSAVGASALRSNTTGYRNSAVGREALRYTTTGANNSSYSNCAGLGYDTRVSGSNQVQLGDSSTTTYAYGAVQDRSDARDKADIRDTQLGLDFINRLRPVDFRWDMRDDYFAWTEETDPETEEVTEKLVPVEKDGSRKRGRFHHGLIAQEVEAVIKETGIDFGGFQNHSYSGEGDDILSIGYTELIAPLIRAVQELTERIKILEAS